MANHSICLRAGAAALARTAADTTAANFRRYATSAPKECPGFPKEYPGFPKEYPGFPNECPGSHGEPGRGTSISRTAYGGACANDLLKLGKFPHDRVF